MSNKAGTPISFYIPADEEDLIPLLEAICEAFNMDRSSGLRRLIKLAAAKLGYLEANTFAPIPEAYKKLGIKLPAKKAAAVKTDLVWMVNTCEFCVDGKVHFIKCRTNADVLARVKLLLKGCNQSFIFVRDIDSKGVAGAWYKYEFVGSELTCTEVEDAA